MDDVKKPVLDGNASSDSTSTQTPDLNNLDKLFGVEEGGKNFKPDTKTEGRVSFDDLKSDGDSSKVQGQKSYEDTLRLLQSERDKAFAKAQKLESDVKEKESLAAFIEALYKDQEVRRSFIAEVEPELMKPKDPFSLIKEKLGKEFGEDFTPDRDDVNVAGTKSWLYNKRAELMLNEMNQKHDTPLPIKELLKQREQQKVEAMRAAEAEKRETMQKLNWDEAAWNGFAQWMKSGNTLGFGQIYDRLTKGSGTQPPYVTNQPGFNNRNTSNEFDNLKKFFG